MTWNPRWKLAESLGLATGMALALVALPALVFAGQEGDVAPNEQVTFTKDVMPILQRSCQRCHHPDSIAPMSLITYEEVRPYARAIKYRTGLRNSPGVAGIYAMPPWYIDRNIGIQKFKDDPSLSDEEIATLATWADSGARRGNPADMPPPIAFIDADEWELGSPDLIVSSRSVTMKGQASDWWGPIGDAPTGLTEDRYVASIQMREVNDLDRQTGRATIGGLHIFHHLTMRQAGPDGVVYEDEAAQGWPTHEVGRNSDIIDPAAGKLLRAGSKFVFPSAHLHSTGTDTTGHVEIGLTFHPKGYQPKTTLVRVGGSTGDLDIKGMEADQRIEAFTTLRENTKLVSFEPHMHAAGVRMCLDAIWGSTVETLACAGYNHSWVRVYTYAEDAAPLLPKFTILRITGYFDNTPANKNVSDPRNWSGLGHRSIDNMLIHIGRGIQLSDEEFEQELVKRRESLTEGQMVPGCPLCGYSKIPVTTASNQTP